MNKKLFRILVLVFFVFFSFACSVPFLNGGSSTDYVINDEFKSNKNNWIEGDYSGDYADANYQIANGVYAWTVYSNDVANVTSWPDMDFVGDFTATVKAKQTSDNYDDADFGLIYIVPDSNHFLSFTISNQDYSVYVFEEATSWTELVGWSHSDALLPGEFNDLIVTRSGDDFVFSANGQELCTITYSAISQGVLGLNVDIFPVGVTGTFEFDDFTVTTP